MMSDTSDDEEEKQSPMTKRIRSLPPDIVVEVGSGEAMREFHCYKAALCFASPVFDLMFSNDMVGCKVETVCRGEPSLLTTLAPTRPKTTAIGCGFQRRPLKSLCYFIPSLSTQAGSTPTTRAPWRLGSTSSRYVGVGVASNS